MNGVGKGDSLSLPLSSYVALNKSLDLSGPPEKVGTPDFVEGDE